MVSRNSTLLSRGVWTALMVALAACFFLMSGCSQSSHESGPGSGAGTMEAQPESSELLDRSYGYLVRGDHDFARLAPNYSTLRPFTPDTSLVVETRSQAEGIDSPAADFTEFLHVRIHREMPLRFVIADSTGAGLIVYEIKDLATGAYTVGSTGWPVPQVDLLAEHDWVYVYVVGDTRFRWRERFRLDDNRNLVPLAPAEAAS